LNEDYFLIILINFFNFILLLVVDFLLKEFIVMDNMVILFILIG